MLMFNEATGQNETTLVIVSEEVAESPEVKYHDVISEIVTFYRHLYK